jgi:hypothetical protein
MTGHPVPPTWRIRIGLMPLGVKGQTALQLAYWHAYGFTSLMAGVAYGPIAEARIKAYPEPKLHLPAWVPADFVDLSDWESQAAEWGPAPGGLDAPWSKRKAVYVLSVTAMVLDLDEAFDRAKADVLCAPWVHFGHTSWRHTPEAPKARLVFPFRAAVPVADWLPVWAAGARWAAAHGLTTDPACKDPCRAYFLPVRPPGREEHFEVWGGAGAEGLLDAAWLLRHYPPPPPPTVPKPPAALRVNPYSPAATAPAEEVAARRARAYMEKVAGGLRGQGKGGRNKACFDAGLALGRRAAILGDGACAHFQAALIDAATSIGLSDAEARLAIRNGIEAGLTSPLESTP